MSRRTGIIGLSVSLLALVVTVALAVTGVAASIPGLHVRSWLGIATPPLPDLCKFDPAKVHEAPGQPIAGAWRSEPNSPTPSAELGATVVGGDIYMVGGQLRAGTESTVIRFSPRTRTYHRETNLPVAIDHPVVSRHDGEVIVASGYIDGAHSTNRAWAYSPRTKEWRELPSMHFPRGAAGGAVIGDRLYVAGGVYEFGSEYTPMHSMEIYDFDDEEWTVGPPMPTARHHVGAVALDGKLYVAGGREPNDLSLDAFEEYDPATGRWRRLPPLPIGLGALGVTAAEGRVVITGGGEDTIAGAPGGWLVRAAYAYDPGTMKWTRLPDLGHARHGHAAVTADGRIYVLRGIPCPDYGQLASVESLAASSLERR
jgi:Kelch motif/Galactose oxidase, central domain